MPQTIKQIKSRIESIKSTKKITNAMELISRTKYQISFKKLSYSRDYLSNIENFLSRILLKKDILKFLENFNTNKTILILFSSDNGFCSNYNIEILKKLENFLSGRKKENIEIYLIGKKIYNNILSLGLSCEKIYTGYLGKYSKDIVSSLSENIIKSGANDIYIIYTKFYSSVKQDATLESVFKVFNEKIQYPLNISNSKNLDLNLDLIENNELHNSLDSKHFRHFLNFRKTQNSFGKDSINNDDFNKSEYIKELKFDNDFFDKIMRLFLFAKLKNVFLESIVSEHATRMLAMKTANDNAKHILEKLVLSLNKTRQALITGELIEIISSSDAIKNS